jgi:hypothetical protein
MRAPVRNFLAEALIALAMIGPVGRCTPASHEPMNTLQGLDARGGVAVANSRWTGSRGASAAACVSGGNAFDANAAWAVFGKMV